MCWQTAYFLGKTIYSKKLNLKFVHFKILGRGWLPCIYPLSNFLKRINRSNHPEVVCKKGVLKNFAKFTGKYLFWSLFLLKLQAGNLIKERLQRRCFLWAVRNTLFANGYFCTEIVDCSKLNLQWQIWNFSQGARSRGVELTGRFFGIIWQIVFKLEYFFCQGK